MEPLVLLLQNVLVNFHALFLNWAYAIIALTLAIRICIFPFQVILFKQQKLLQKIKPSLDSLKLQFKEKPLELLQKSNELKKKSGVKTSLILCLSLIQLPILISMYRAVHSTRALAGAGFVWIPSLAAHDPLFILPLLVAFLSYLQQRRSLSGQLDDPKAQSALKFMPLISLFFMASLPAGLTLYYVTSSALQLLGDVGLNRWS